MPATSPARDLSVIARAPRVGLAVLYVFTTVALVGYATFGLNPSLLGRYPAVAGFYGLSFQFFAQAQIWLAWIVLAFFLLVWAEWRWVPAFLVLYVISLSSELLGTSLGIPFGEYHYTEGLGSRWFGHVPVVIPLSWFFMAVPSYAMALAAVRGSKAGRVLMGSLILVSWDLALDPAMSRATAYWVWAEPGAYYGMPWLNLFGWYVTGLALMTALALVRADGWLARLPLRWLAAFYGANLLLPLGMNVAAGLWGAVMAMIAAVGGAALLARVVAGPRPLPAVSREVAT